MKAIRNLLDMCILEKNQCTFSIDSLVSTILGFNHKEQLTYLN